RQRTAGAAPPSRAGRRLGRALAVYRALRRVPPGGRRRRLRDQCGRAAAARGNTRADRGGGTGRAVSDAEVREEPDQRRPARLDHRLRPVGEASGRPRRLEHRPDRPGPRGPRRLADRSGRAGRVLRRDRKESAAMNALRRWAIALGVLALGRKQRRPRFADRPRIVPPGAPDPRAEWLVLGLLLGAAAAGALGAALVVPALSLGPFFDTDALYETPWRRGRRLVDEHGKPFLLDELERETFYTAYPEGADKEEVGSPLVVVRFEPSELDLPAGRRDWAPGGVVAYSKICTHAGCAVALFRKPTFRPVEPGPALICPCHYSTFDPTRGANVIFGPAGRPLPQLPLLLDRENGELLAAGNFSGPVGPSWWGVRSKAPRNPS